jgi:hypothetical protein
MRALGRLWLLGSRRSGSGCGTRGTATRGTATRGTATWSTSTRADVLAQDSLVGNGDDAALGLLASGSAAGDEIGSAGRSGGG